MNELYAWFHDDIAWCLDDECPYVECERNIQNRLTKGGMYSASDFSKEDWCLRKKQNKSDENT